LLSATFSSDGNALVLDEFTQVSDENLIVRESGASYEFVLSEGTWSGTAVAGVSGDGTATLSVDKAAVAGLAGGIVIDSYIVNSTPLQTDLVFETADFSTLSGGLHANAQAVRQADGHTLTVSALDVHAVTVDVRGDIVGGAGDILLEAARTAAFVGASISTTSGEIRLTGN
jgi:hypothetical protein